jgi:WD40 repeat protein
MKRTRGAGKSKVETAREPAAPSGSESALPAAQVEALRPAVNEQLRTADVRRLGLLMPLFEERRLRLARVLDALFPGVERTTQQTLLRNFRTALNEGLKDAGLDVRFVADSRKRDSVEERFCWFEGGMSSAAPLLTQFTDSLVGTTDPAKSVSPRASLEPERQLVRYSVVYDEADAPLAESLVAMLRTFMAGSRKYRFEGWAPCDHLVGVNRDETREIKEKESQIVLGLLSPALIADTQAKNRASALQAGGRLLVPVALGSVDEKRQDLGPFDGRVAFRGPRRAFERCSATDKKRFAEELWHAIEDTLGPASLTLPDSRAEAIAADLFEGQVRQLDLPDHAVRARARETAILLAGRNEKEAEEPADRSAPSPKTDAVEAVPYLQKWAGDPAAPPFFALLGETGSGKTTTCKLLARRMLDARQTNPGAPLPIYLDLRRFSWDGTPNFSLQAILQMVLAKSFEASTGPIPSPNDVIEHVQQQGAVVLFDGLDEVIVHMPPKLGQDFIRELWRILPPLKKAGERTVQTGKLLLSCRSHYFRRVWEQNTMLLGEEREGLRSVDYRALMLLPFEPAQIEEYLRHNVPGLDVNRALELIRSVHNLSEMAERPYTLSLIGEYLPELERKIAAGDEIQGVDLYKAMVTRWLLRDEGKHQFNTAHKEVLMERLAARLWASRRREWSCEELEDWLDDELNHDDRLRGAYGEQQREVLKEDLRTATFLVRPDAESFRFAHTSLQEYFLARHLQRALREGAEERWSLPIPSDETIEFLVQLVRGARTERPMFERTLEAILGRYRPLGSELALRFWLETRKHGDGPSTPRRFDLRGAQLNGWRISGRKGQRLNLRGADLRGANLRNAVFERVDLSEADLSGADATRTGFHDVDAAKARFDAAEDRSAGLSGALWRLSTLSDIDMSRAMLDRCRFIRCRFSGMNWPSAGHLPIFAACREEAGERSTLAGALPDAATTPFQMFTGHGGVVLACAVSPDGRRIVSGSSDQTLRVWDATSGERVLTLEGHGGAVLACAVSADGRRIVSGSDDHTLRVWDATSGESVLTLEGHRGAVRACAVSPDGRRIVSGSSDQTLRVWDATSGESVLTLEGHGGAVLACAVSADGRWIVSGSSDQTLRVWDATSGESVLTLEGHRGAVRACAVSPDGRRIVSGSSDQRIVWGSYDKTLREWDATSGESVLTLEGHRGGVNACAVSPDGRRIVSGSSDQTLRVWDAMSGEKVLTLEGHRGAVSVCAVSPDGRRIVSGWSDQTLRVWDATSGESVLTLEGHGDWVNACAVSPDGRRIVSSSYDKTLRVWDATSGESVLTLEGHGGAVLACAVSPDGRRIVSGSDDQTLRVWDATSGESVLTLEGHGGSVRACAVSPDGRRIVSGSYDQTLRVWDATSGESVLTLEGHGGAVLACAVSPDGRRIVSGSSDQTLRAWDATSGESVLTLEGHRGAVRACAVSADGSRIVSGSDDNTLRVWDARSGAPLLTIARFNDGEEAVLDENPRRLRRASPGAWRWLGWLARDPVTGLLDRFPAESFGPLPGAE